MLENIGGKPTDYKMCKECHCFNWYENTECHNCASKEFDASEQAVMKQYDDEVEFCLAFEIEIREVTI